MRMVCCPLVQAIIIVLFCAAALYAIFDLMAYCLLPGKEGKTCV